MKFQEYISHTFVAFLKKENNKEEEDYVSLYYCDFSWNKN